MIFFYVGIVLGMILLTYGTKKGWLAGKIDMLEAQPKEAPTFKEMVEEDNEGFDPNKNLFERFRERAEGDTDFKQRAMDFAKERKERMFKGMSAKEREMLENYLRESIEQAKKDEAEGKDSGYEAFRSYTCEVFVLCSLGLFIWWGASRHYQMISPVHIAETLFKSFNEFFGMNKGAKYDL